MFESSRAHHQSQNPVKSGYLAGFFRVTASTGIAHELGVEATHDREASIDWSRIYLIPVVLFGWHKPHAQLPGCLVSTTLAGRLKWVKALPIGADGCMMGDSGADV